MSTKQYSKEDNDLFFQSVLKRKFDSCKPCKDLIHDFEQFTFIYNNPQKISNIKERYITKYDNMSLTKNEKNELKKRFNSLSFKQAFIENYFSNTQARCCICGQLLETAKNDTGDSYIVADIEHIFPKSKFPQFVFVYKNWIPCCKECNQTIKNDNFFIDNPIVKFQKALSSLGASHENMHPLQLWKNYKMIYNKNIDICINRKLCNEAKEFLNFYNIENRLKDIASHCYDILFNIIRNSDIRTPESLENLLENIASSNWNEINDGYSLNNSPQIWQEFIENILYDECKLMALWDEIKSSELRFL